MDSLQSGGTLYDEYITNKETKQVVLCAQSTSFESLLGIFDHEEQQNMANLK